MINVIKTALEGVVILEPKLFCDERGYFCESFRDSDFRETVCDITFVQENEASSKIGVIRGLHFQNPPYAQSKLVRVIKGRVLDIAVDIRKGSPTYGKHVAVELSEKNHRQLFIPQGFAHGYAVLSNEVTFLYKCDNYYNKASEGAIVWNDADLKINWQIGTSGAIISAKDQQNQLFKELDSQFIYE